jgi:hypothetical protein
VREADGGSVDIKEKRMKAKSAVLGLLGVAVLLIAAPPAATQFPGRGPAGPPAMSGVWNPVVGTGAVYISEAKGKRQEMEMAVVGEERVGNETGHWLEITMQDPTHGQFVMKTLYVARGGKLDPRRMIVQMAGQPPMEIPVEMRGRMGMATDDQTADVREGSMLVGEVTIETPAGAIVCKQYRSAGGNSDACISDDIYPYGVVRSNGPRGSMTLVRRIAGAKTKITGTPMRMDQMMPPMPR